MNSHVIYTYNERDLTKMSKTFETNSVTNLIDTCIAYTPLSSQNLQSLQQFATVSKFPAPIGYTFTLTS